MAVFKAYVDGFSQRCQESGIGPDQLVKFAARFDMALRLASLAKPETGEALIRSHIPKMSRGSELASHLAGELDLLWRDAQARGITPADLVKSYSKPLIIAELLERAKAMGKLPSWAGQKITTRARVFDKALSTMGRFTKDKSRPFSDLFHRETRLE